MKAVFFGFLLVGLIAYAMSADAKTNSDIQSGVNSAKDGAQNVGDKIKSAVGWGQEKTAEARDKTADKMREGAEKVETR